MIARAAAAAVAALVIPMLVAAQKPAGFDDAWAATVATFRHLSESEGMVGSSIWFFRGNEELGRAFHGYADLETRRPVDENTIWHWASNTKTLTGIGALQLRDRGLLDLDDPIVEYVPELRAVHDPFGPVEKITIRHLLSHSAGFRAGTWPWGGDEEWHPWEPGEWSQLVAMMPYTDVRFEPGSKYSYSNPGIVFVGRAIENITGEDWEVYVDKNILRPLGMYRSYFDITPYHLLQHRSNSYAVRNGEPVPNGLDFDTGITVSNGGLNAPVPDMARYFAFLAGDPAAEVVLARASLEEMWQPIVPVGESPGGGRESMGITFFITDVGGARVVGHTGSQRAFQSFFHLDPATRAIAIATFNTDAGSGGHPDARRILNALRANVLETLFPLFRK